MALWYGYKYQNGQYQAKRYFDGRDLADVRESPFTTLITETPIEADSYDLALHITEVMDKEIFEE